MTTLVLEKDPLAVNVSLTPRHLTIELADGRRVSVPLEWYPRLLEASKVERQHWRLLGDGYAIEWPEVDEHIGVEGLLAGRSSGENARSLNRWLASRAKQKKQAKASATRKPSTKEAAKS